MSVRNAWNRMLKSSKILKIRILANLEILEEIKNSLEKQKLAAIVGWYQPKMKLLLARAIICLEKPIWAETERSLSINMHFGMKLSDFGSAVEWQTASRDFISGQTFTRIVFFSILAKFCNKKVPRMEKFCYVKSSKMWNFRFFFEKSQKKHFRSICITKCIK